MVSKTKSNKYDIKNSLGILFIVNMLDLILTYLNRYYTLEAIDQFLPSSCFNNFSMKCSFFKPYFFNQAAREQGPFTYLSFQISALDSFLFGFKLVLALIIPFFTSQSNSGAALATYFVKAIIAIICSCLWLWVVVFCGARLVAADGVWLAFAEKDRNHTRACHNIFLSGLFYFIDGITCIFVIFSSKVANYAKYIFEFKENIDVFFQILLHKLALFSLHMDTRRHVLYLMTFTSLFFSVWQKQEERGFPMFFLALPCGVQFLWEEFDYNMFDSFFKFI